jgi:hypothetical protein
MSKKERKNGICEDHVIEKTYSGKNVVATIKFIIAKQ